MEYLPGLEGPDDIAEQTQGQVIYLDFHGRDEPANPSASVSASGEIWEYWNGAETIPDNGGPSWDMGRVSLDVTDAPEGATITAVDVYYEVKHDNIGDLKVWMTTDLGGDNWQDYDLHKRTGGSADNIADWIPGIDKWDGEDASRTWWLVAGDYVAGIEGYLDFFEVHVHWETVGDLEATLENHNGSEPSGSDTCFWLYTSPAEQQTGSNPATFYDVQTGSYWLEGYYTGSSFGEEFWSSREVTISADQTTYQTLNRDEPYGYDFAALNGSTDDTGTTLASKLQVKVKAKGRLAGKGVQQAHPVSKTHRDARGQVSGTKGSPGGDAAAGWAMPSAGSHHEPTKET